MESGFDFRNGLDRFSVLQNDPKECGVEEGLTGVKQIKNAGNSICSPPYISMIRCQVQKVAVCVPSHTVKFMICAPNCLN
jgi:hypothetical protein